MRRQGCPDCGVELLSGEGCAMVEVCRAQIEWIDWLKRKCADFFR